MIKVLVDMPVFEPLLQRLENMDGIEVNLVKEPDERLRALPIEQVHDCNIIFCTFPPANQHEMSKLKLIQISSAGYKQLIGLRLGERSIRACNALGVFDIPIAEWNISMMVNLARDLRGLIRNQDSGIWDRSARFQKEIRGSVVGIWGYGGIGRETARLAKAMGMKVFVLNRSSIRPRENIYRVAGTGDPEGMLPDRIFLMNEMKAFLSDLDFLILAIPQTISTEGIIGEKELRMLQPKTYLLNPARGALINEQALLKALNYGWIAGAAIDTHYYYPMPADHPLWHFPNVIMTPHISGSSASPHFLERVWEIFLENVTRIKRGEKLLNELSAAQLNGD